MSAMLNAPTPNFPNRTLAIMDNIAFLKMLDNESIDLIAIDPPFAANETFEGKPKPAITPAEMRAEYALATRHGPTALARYLDNEVVISPRYADGYASAAKIGLEARATYIDGALASDPDGVFLTNEAVTTVKDDWFWKDVNEGWMKELRDAGKEVQDYNERIKAGEAVPADETPTKRDVTLDAMREVIEAVTACATENEAAYIAEMSVRLYECRRVLKPTGSIYVHCDHHANSYLRMLMDAIFGHKNFRNEIVWRRVLGGKSDAGQYPRSSDRIFFYTKGQEFTFHAPRLKDVNDSWYRKQDDKGRYSSQKLTAYGSTSGDSGQPWRGKMPTGHWVVPKLLTKRYEIETGKTLVGSVRERLDILADAGYIDFSKSGLPSWRRYLSEANPPRVADIWTDDEVKPISRQSPERTGYSTQKPLALYQRIVRASSNPGDVVLDLFAGCATTAIAAELEGRRWLACDMAYRASTMMMRRFYRNGHQLEGMNVGIVRDAIGEHQTKFEHKGKDGGRIIGPPDLPNYPRLTADPDDGVPATATTKRAPISNTWTGGIPKDEVKDIFIERFGPVCWGCGFEARRPNGTINRSQIEVDHMRARKAKEGEKGDDELYNLALLCAYCNRKKGNHRTLEQVREMNAHAGALYVNTISELVDLHIAQRFAFAKMQERGVQAGLP